MKIPREVGVVSLFKGTLARLASAPRRPLNVLIVDDEAPVWQFVERVVQKAGHATTTFKEKVALWHDEAFLEKPCSVNGLMEAVSLLVFGRFETLQPSR